jgi:hypothetical protein
MWYLHTHQHGRPVSSARYCTSCGLDLVDICPRCREADPEGPHWWQDGTRDFRDTLSHVFNFIPTSILFNSDQTESSCACRLSFPDSQIRIELPVRMIRTGQLFLSTIMAHTSLEATPIPIASAREEDMSQKFCRLSFS